MTKSEDGIVVTDNFITVIDGSTSKTDCRYHHRMSNCCYAMTIISDFIRHMPSNISCQQFCITVSSIIRKHYLPFWLINKEATINRLINHPEELLCASLALCSRLRREIWLVDDCQCMIGGQIYNNPKPYEETLAQQRAKKVIELLENGMTVNDLLTKDVARHSIIPQMLENMKGQKQSYAVIDGFPIPQQHVPIITLNYKQWEIILATDGYPFLCTPPQESEQQFLQQHNKDPLNIGFLKATKGFMNYNNFFDDRAFIRFLSE